MNFNRVIAASAIAGVVWLATACAPLSPRLDARFGESVAVIRAQQSLNADAPPSTELTQLDGSAAHEALGRYTASFRTPPAQPAFTIGVSGAGAAQ